MKIAAIIEARMNSSRLPGKVMLKVNNIPLLEILVNRLKFSKYLDDIIIATTINSKDDEIVDFCNLKGIKFYRGSENNVLERVCDTAKLFNIDVIVEVCADNCFLDPNLIDNQIETFKQVYPKSKFVSDVFSYHDSFLPVGFDVKIFSSKDLFEINNFPSELDKEHVSQRFYQVDFQQEFNPTFVKFAPELNRPELFCVLDYYEDYKMMEQCYIDLNQIKMSLNTCCSLSVVKYELSHM